MVYYKSLLFNAKINKHYSREATLMRQHNLSPRLIKSFLTVLRMQSHTKAAQALNLTQPAVSQHISRLEDILEIRLLERTHGAIVPTKEAHALIPDFERLERSVEMMFQKARTVAHSEQHPVQIATPSSMISYLLTPAIADLWKSGSQVFPAFREFDDYRVYDMVRAGEVDFALTSMTGNDAGLSQALLLQDRPCVVFPSGHDLDGQGYVEIDEILPFKLIRPPLDTAANRIIEACQAAAGVEFSFSSESSRLMSMHMIVRAGLGLVILPGLSAHLIAHTNLKYRPIRIDEGFRSCQLIQTYGKRLSSSAQQIADAVKTRAKQLNKEFPNLLV